MLNFYARIKKLKNRSCVYKICPVTRVFGRFLTSKGLFTWRRGASANRVIPLGGLIHSPRLHAAHLSGIVSRLSFERPLSTTNNMADEKKRFDGKFYYFITFSTIGRFSVCRVIILHFND